jgi:hypothetical protein
MRKYIYYSTILGIFTGALIYRAAFDIRLFYIILLFNLLFVALLSPLRISRWIAYMVFYLFLSGVVGIVRGTDTIGQFLKEFLGITANAIFYYNFFRLYRNDYRRAFSTYARASYFVCILGFPILLLESLMAGKLTRLHSVTLEPAAFCELVLPAYFWYASNYLTRRKYGREVLIFSLAIALSGSSLGYISVAFGIVLLPLRRKRWLMATPLVVVALVGLIYSISSNFRTRADDTVAALTTMEVSGGSNLSTFSLISNGMVAKEVLHESPWIGNGLGSHVISHRRLIGDIPGIESVPDDWGEVNATEAGSLAIRLLSEQGLIGLGLVLWVIIKFHAGWQGQEAIISNALLTCFFLKLIRGGAYFGPEQFFFVFVYLLNYRSYKIAQMRRFAVNKDSDINQRVHHATISTSGYLAEGSNS